MTKETEGDSDATPERDEEQPVDRLECFDGAAHITRDHELQDMRAVTHVGNEGLVDPKDEGNGAAGNARHDVGGSHAKAAKELEERGWNHVATVGHRGE
ncbi:MAG: hypothetical protein R2706_14970 [Acidimicrobiales bacterium]